MTTPFVQRCETYLAKARYDEPKQVFKFLADRIESSGVDTTGTTLLDIGCATGEMIYYLKRRFPAMRFTGIDNQPRLLETARAQESLRDAGFHEHDAIGYRGEPCDVVTCFGMLGAFDQFEPLFDTLVANARPGGRIFVHALINDVDIDVRVLYRDRAYNESWQRGFNIFSFAQIAAWLTGKVTSWRLHPFELDVDVAPKPETPHRAYTRKAEDGRRFTTNGLCLILPEKVLEIIV